jgi:hypothetical protein
MFRNFLVCLLVVMTYCLKIECGIIWMFVMFLINHPLADEEYGGVMMKQYRKTIFYLQNLNGLRILILKINKIRSDCSR